MNPRKVAQPKVQVAGTNDYSIHSKASIVAKGYVEDPFLNWFVGGDQWSSNRRSPIINRGYYVRHRALEFGFRKALASSSSNVVISLGAGFDTSALRYHKEAFFIELDYPAVCRRKADILAEDDRLAKVLQCSSNELIFSNNSNCFITSPRYLLLGVDLRQPENVVKTLVEEKVLEKVLLTSKSSSINFILLNECSLCYIAQEDADALLAKMLDFLTDKLSPERKVTFTYLGYEMLASETSTPDYGQFLLCHFDAMGAGILTFLREAEINERFLIKRLHFDELEMINMKTFWRGPQLNGNETERKRIRSLEPFDEFEELDSVCSSYALTIARKGRKVTENGDQVKVKNRLETSSEKELSPFVQYNNLLSVFGHCSHFDAEKGQIRIFGGFGLEPMDSNESRKSNSGHRRYRPIVELHIPQTNSKRNSSNTDPHLRLLHSSQSPLSAINRVHAQVVHLGGNFSTSRYLLSGGRTSPTAIQASAILEIEDQGSSATTYRLVDQLDWNAPKAFRHVCSRLGVNSEKIIQFGGITDQEKSTQKGTVFLFEINTNSWSKTQINNFDTERHSAAFTSFGDHSLLINGGLDLATDSFQSRFAPFELIDSREMTVHEMKLRKSDHDLQLLYGHRLQMINDHEVLVVGGIGNQKIENTALRVDLRALAVTAMYRLQCQSQSLLMLHNHTTALTADNRLVIIGGGGNCFSFGTHFNPLLFYELP